MNRIKIFTKKIKAINFISKTHIIYLSIYLSISIYILIKKNDTVSIFFNFKCISIKKNDIVL